MSAERLAQHERWKAANGRIVGAPPLITMPPSIAARARGPSSPRTSSLAAARARGRQLFDGLPRAITTQPSLAREIRRILWNTGVAWREFMRTGPVPRVVSDARRFAVQRIRQATGWSMQRISDRTGITFSTVKHAMNAADASS